VSGTVPPNESPQYPNPVADRLPVRMRPPLTVNRSGCLARSSGAAFGRYWRELYSTPISVSMRAASPADIWWRTGCLGPQSIQPEVMDLYARRCPEDLRAFEAAFIERCPNEVLATHDETRVPPHIAARAWMGGEMLASARDLMERWRRWYLLRDVHVVAMMAAWDVPVRLADWAPAYIEQARWDARRREARIVIDAPQRGCALRWAASEEVAAVSVDGHDAAFTVAQQREDWTVYALDLPAGRHQVHVQVGSPRD